MVLVIPQELRASEKASAGTLEHWTLEKSWKKPEKLKMWKTSEDGKIREEEKSTQTESATENTDATKTSNSM